MIGNYIQHVIDTRGTTEIVHKYESHIDEIKNMYKNTNKNAIDFKLSLSDVRYLCEKQLPKLIKSYKN